MKFRPIGDELFKADGQPNGNDVIFRCIIAVVL